MEKYVGKECEYVFSIATPKTKVVIERIDYRFGTECGLISKNGVFYLPFDLKIL